MILDKVIFPDLSPRSLKIFSAICGLYRLGGGSSEGVFYFWSDETQECNPCTVCPQVGYNTLHSDDDVDDDNDDDHHND